MPSELHDALVRLFRNRPELAPELLARALGVDVPVFGEARIEDAMFTDLQPAEYRADLVVLLSDGVPVLAIVVEVQLGKDEDKRFSWPIYVTGLRARFRCPACVLVVAMSASVAKWARRPIELGLGSKLLPLVVGPNGVPVVSDPEEAKRDPELAVLSAMAHGRASPDVARAVTIAAVNSVRDLNSDRVMLYLDLIANSLGAAARKAFEELMRPANYEWQSDFARKYWYGGKAEGKVEGVVETGAKAVLIVLRARGISLSAEQEALVVQCTDVSMLDRWLVRAATIATADELFV